MNKGTWAKIATAVCMICALTACGGGSEQGGDTANVLNDPEYEEAITLYKQNCVGCHATNLSGRVGPDLRKVGTDMAKADIEAKIYSGGGGMTAFKNILEKDQIDKLAEWLSELK